MNLRKTIIFSSLISINTVLWYEVLGMKFLIGALLAITILILFTWKK